MPSIVVGRRRGTNDTLRGETLASNAASMTAAHKKRAGHVTQLSSRACGSCIDSAARQITLLLGQGVTYGYERTTSDLPTPQAQAIADLTGYEDAATLRWQQACVQAANTLTALPNGRYVTVRMERMRQGLELAQRGAVTLPEDREELTPGAQWQHAPPGRHPPAHLHLHGLPDATCRPASICSRSEITSGRSGFSGRAPAA